MRVSDPAALRLIDVALPPGSKPARSGAVEHIVSFVLGGPGARPGLRRFHVVFADGEPAVRTHDLEGALDVLEASIRLFVALRARRRMFVHAGAVGVRGGGLMIPGTSESGKSTLVRALLGAGASYFSDEHAVVDPHERMHPYPLRLSFDEEGVHRRIPAGELGAVTADAPEPVRLVLVTRYRPGARFRPRRLSPASGMMAVLPHVVAATIRPRSTFNGLARLVEKVPVFASDRSDTAAVVDWLHREGWLDATPTPGGRVQSHDTAARGAVDGHPDPVLVHAVTSGPVTTRTDTSRRAPDERRRRSGHPARVNQS